MLCGPDFCFPPEAQTQTRSVGPHDNKCAQLSLKYFEFVKLILTHQLTAFTFYQAEGFGSATGAWSKTFMKYLKKKKKIADGTI